ncbi:ATP-binding protein [Nonomuraea sp. NN258]|uniref:ATP-binding protein n=1 Tax=Nonomuraea antri TaxID=2730852 RepID=UPI00156A4D4A|nr:ATP-binding protein [Nonomuraea antri]NRQ30290.1 ATP-binding protein [Nonomuraea antri]
MTRLRSARPSRMRNVWPVREEAQAVGHSRSIVRAELSGLGLPAELVDDAVLMVSELITNAFLYGAAPYELVLHVDTEEIRCAVVDSNTALPEPGAADPRAEHGRGLHIVAALSEGFYGCHPQRYVTSPGLLGKATWFALPRGPRRPPAAEPAMTSPAMKSSA